MDSEIASAELQRLLGKLALREDDAPFSGVGFPYAGIEAAVGALKQVGPCLGGIAGEDAVSLRPVALRLRERILEALGLGSLAVSPCFQAPLALPLGAPPRAPWKRQTWYPRTARALQRWAGPLGLAVQQGAF